jgi:hypothetical protein
MEYFNLPEKNGDLYVKGNDKWINRKIGKKSRLKYNFLKKIYDYCDNTQKSNYVDIFKKATGGFMYSDEKKYSSIIAYLYNPDNYPGVHEVKNAIELVNGNVKYNENVTFPFIELVINDKLIYIPQCYIKDEDFEMLE